MLARPAGLFGLALHLALAGCSADAVSPPEPVIERPGAFVAVTDDDGVIFLVRTLRIVRIDSAESLYEAILYQGAPSSYDEAQAWAKDREWPVADEHVSYSFRVILSHDPEVVWFRTLTRDELALVLD
jgi:hypothetical protein